VTVTLSAADRLSAPLVPVTVTDVVASAAAFVAHTVTDVVEPLTTFITDTGVNVAETPAGSVPVLKVTVPVKPPVVLMITVTAGPQAPRSAETLVGLVEIVKSDCAITVRLIVVVRVNAGVVALVPVIVTLNAPTVAVADAVKVSVLLVPVVEAGLNVAVTPVGNPLAASDTEDEKAVRVMPMVLLAVKPRVTDTFAGVGVSVKLAEGFTVSATVVVRVSSGVPPVPVIVMAIGAPLAVALAAAVKVNSVALAVKGLTAIAAVTPAGRGVLTLRVTAAGKFVRVIAITVRPVEP
jgi:hypothetical protein